MTLFPRELQSPFIVATDLNSASDELTEAISAINTVLQGLNIGLATWTTIDSGNGLPDDGSYWSRSLGYAKIGNKWGIALRDVAGDANYPNEELCDEWLFNDAPRWLRLAGISKIPDLLETMVKTTQETTKKIRVKTAEAEQLAAVIAQAAGKKASQGGK